MSTFSQRFVVPRSGLARFTTPPIPKILFCAILAISGLLSSNLSAATVYYVSSQNGNDSWSGLLAAPNASHTDGPFQTLGKAKAQMESSSNVKTVNVRAGTYSIASTLQFNSADSGQTWTAYPGESPVLEGSGSGQIILNNPSNLTIEGLTIQNMGAGGLDINYGNAVSLRWNNFYNCNQNCISGSGAENSTIDSNTFNGQGPGNPSGNVGYGYSTISLGYGSSNNHITHNLLENCQGGGIAFSSGPSDPPNNNNIVDRNIFQNIDTNIVDGGAIYMLDNTHSAIGNQITNNLVNGNIGSGYWTKAYYLDGDMSNVLISGNVCRSCGEWAWQVHVGDHNTIVNNIFDLSASGSLLGLYQTNPAGQDWGMTGNVFERNIVYFSGGVPPSLYQVNVVSSDALPADQSNLYYSTNKYSIPNLYIVDTNPVYADPQFASPSDGNYSMPSSSPAYTMIGFQPLPTDQGPLSGGPSGNTGPLGSGSLNGSGNSSNNTADLTAEGSSDWVHWQTTSLTRKSNVSAQISAWSVVGSNTASYYTNDPRAVTFTDGSGPRSATVTDGIFISGQNGFAISVPAGTSAHTLTVHVGGYFSSGTLKAHLSDGSAADYVDTTNAASGQYDRNYTLTYNAASAGQTLIVSWVCNSESGNVTLNGAALQ